MIVRSHQITVVNLEATVIWTTNISPRTLINEYFILTCHRMEVDVSNH